MEPCPLPCGSMSNPTESRSSEQTGNGLTSYFSTEAKGWTKNYEHMRLVLIDT